MNSDTQITAEEIIKAAGVVVPCQTCMSNDIRSGDDNADRMAYAMATNAWKDEERGFRGMAREEVMQIMKGAIDSANNRCPSCGTEW